MKRIEKKLKHHKTQQRELCLAAVLGRTRRTRCLSVTDRDSAALSEPKEMSVFL